MRTTTSSPPKSSTPAHTSQPQPPLQLPTLAYSPTYTCKHPILYTLIGTLMMLITLLWLAPALIGLTLWQCIYRLIYLPMKSNNSTILQHYHNTTHQLAKSVLDDPHDVALMVLSILIFLLNLLSTLTLLYIWYLYQAHQITIYTLLTAILIRQIIQSTLLPWAFTGKHQESHRLLPIYRSTSSSLYAKIFSYLLNMNHLNEWYTGIFYGNIPFTDTYGHGFIHHRNNLLNYDDDWCNIHCNRSSLLEFTQYIIYAGVWHNTGVGLLYAFCQYKQYKRLIHVLLGMMVYWCIGICIYLYMGWELFVLLIVIPHIANICIGSMANWSWHIFALPNDPYNFIASTITCVKTVGDVFNEGCHLTHHLKPSLHYTEVIQQYEKDKNMYHQRGAIVLESLDPFAVCVLVLSHQWNLLAHCYINPISSTWTLNEKASYLKYRTSAASRASPTNKQHEEL